MKPYLKFSRIFLSVLCMVIITKTLAATQTLTMSETQRLEANIALNMMNRLALTNDRIVNVFGDDGSFVAQTDEQTGQVFIKPSPENGDKPLSLTLITENGLTQDLILNPKAITATTLILKNRAQAQQNTQISECNPSFLNSGSNQPLQEQFIQMMRQAILGELSLSSKKHLSRKNPTGYPCTFIRAYQTGNYLVSVWSIKNTSKNCGLEEKLFYNPGDLALCLENRQVEPGGKTLLYALQRL